MSGREQAERVADERRRSLGEALRTPYAEAGRGFTITGNESEPEESIAVQAGKEIDSQRRDIDETLESMRARQRYFFEKAQMHDEAANLYRRMSEDIADLLNNDFVNKGNKREMNP
jgi:hypothetical protein